MADSVKKVFIVDDDQLFSAMLSTELVKNKMLRVFHFSTGESCISEMHEQPDFIILDYKLSSQVREAKDGLAILEEIKKINNKVHVIMISAQTHYGVAAQTIQKGAEQYVIKDAEAIKKIAQIVDDMIHDDL